MEAAVAQETNAQEPEWHVTEGSSSRAEAVYAALTKGANALGGAEAPEWLEVEDLATPEPAAEPEGSTEARNRGDGGQEEGRHVSLSLGDLIAATEASDSLGPEYEPLPLRVGLTDEEDGQDGDEDTDTNVEVESSEDAGEHDDDDDGGIDEDEDETGGIEDGPYVDEQRSGPAWEAIRRPLIMPQKRFWGMRNVETVKDVNFLGASDDYVCSGSDDGRFFIWKKATAELVGVWEGDGSVVNVVEDRPAHHSYPMLAVSGIDHTIKLFAPTLDGTRPFCHTAKAEEIMETNVSRGASAVRMNRMHLALLYARLRAASSGESPEDDCVIM